MEKFPSLLVVTEKHGTFYFHITNIDELYRIAVEILTTRFNAGYWYPKPTKPKKNKASPRSWKLEMAEYTEDLTVYEEIKKYATESSGPLAWDVLRRRSNKGYEYERVELMAYDTKYGS